MYSLGVPIGMFVDNQGPRPAVLGGSILLASGYFPLHQAYDSASGPVALFCFFSYLSGVGGCMAFAAAVKTSALNWPHNRGTATAFPLAAFGLSAFFFSLIGGILFPGDPSDFLMLLAAGTCSLTFVGFFFLKVYPHSNYQPLSGQNDADHADGDRPARLRRTSSKESKTRRENGLTHDYEPGTSTNASSAARQSTIAVGDAAAVNPEVVDETSSLMSNTSGGDGLVGRSSVDLDRSHRIDIRGFRLLRSLEFWQLFLIMAVLAGIGLMTIKYGPPSSNHVCSADTFSSNIGNDTKALWERYDDSVSQEFLVARQQMHVSILSVCSFLGRLSSGEYPWSIDSMRASNDYTPVRCWI